ncbi:RagB/SusD family nutrient uptake outer membrane protein [Niabella aquatica]
MKKIKIFTFLIVAVTIIAGCKQDFLEEMKSFDSYDESIFTNEIQTGWYVDKLYYDYFSAYKSPIVSVVGLYNDTRTRSTEEIGGTVTDLIHPQKTLINANQADGYYGTALVARAANVPYTRIRTANFLLKKIEEKGQALSDDFKKKVQGQMFFLRGLQYFDLMRIYGGVPIVTEVENATPNDPAVQHPRATVAEVVAQIISDFDAAAELLPATWPTTDYGRFTSGAALAMKNRVLLTYASPLFNPDWDNSGSDRWQKALDAGLTAETALTTAGKGLYGSTAKDWAEMWYINDTKLTDKEAIIIRLLSNSTASSGIESNGWERSIRLTKQTGSGGVSAPKEMIDLFPLENGSRPTVTNGYDSAHFFLNRDPRFYRTFAFSGMKWPTKEATSDVVWLYRWAYTGNKTAYSDGNQVNSPAVVRKMSNPAASTASGLAFSGTDIFEYRYAELLLNIAECYAAKGEIANAVNYLSKIRARVYPSSASANNYGLGTFANKYAALEACLYERRVELAYEGKRFWDAQRWMLYNDDASAGNNTCEKLGIDPINGTARTGRLWQYKTVIGNATDPLTAARGTISVDPDAGDFKTQLNNLKNFFDNNIQIVATDQPMDRDASNTPLYINFRQNYYISGLNNTALSINPWLTQTIGWNDYSGTPGTFNYRQ